MANAIIGRLVSPASAAVLVEATGAEAPALAPTAAIAAVMQDGAGLVLAEGLVLKRSLVMNRQRLELVGFSRHGGGPAEGAGPRFRNHRLEAAAVRAARR